MRPTTRPSAPRAALACVAHGDLRPRPRRWTRRLVLPAGGAAAPRRGARRARPVDDRPGRAVAPAQPGIDLDHHIRDIVEVLHYEDLRDVILVGHSYGGMVITGVADRAADRIGKLVYLDAANPRERAVPRSTWPARSSRRCDPWARWSTAWSWCSCRRPRQACSTGSPTLTTVAWMADRLTGHPWRCFEQKLELTNEDALWAIPQYHIVCTSTLATRDPELMATARAGRPPVGHRHRPRPDAHRAGVGHQRAAARSPPTRPAVRTAAARVERERATTCPRRCGASTSPVGWRVVTGASSGLGEGLARGLASVGATVAVVARRKDRLEPLAERDRRAGRGVRPPRPRAGAGGGAAGRRRASVARRSS